MAIFNLLGESASSLDNTLIGLTNFEKNARNSRQEPARKAYTAVSKFNQTKHRSIVLFAPCLINPAEVSVFPEALPFA